MKLKQRLLSKVYPAFIKVTKALNMQHKTSTSPGKISPPASFYDLSITFNNGTTVACADYKNLKVLIVNTASNCGYTAQYAELQQLFAEHADELVVIGFPSNDFNEQEKGSDEEIAQFCQVNFGVTFPIAKKSSVLKGLGQDQVFKWLTDKNLNGWNDQEPNWNFSKYLIDEKGRLAGYYDPGVLPSEVLK